jgi:hypothetical protein
MEGRASAGDEVKVYGTFFEELFNVMRVFKVNRKLNGQPPIAGALININLHFNKLIKYLSGLTKDGIMQSTPSLFPKFINNVRFFLLNFEQYFLFNILRVVLKNIKKPLQMFMLDFFEHLLAFGVQVLSDIELSVLLLFFLFFLLDLLHIAGLVFVQAQDVVQVAVVDVHLLALFFEVCPFDELDVDFGALLETVVLKGPAWDDAESDFSALESDNKALGGLTDFLFQVLEELSGIGGVLDIDPLGFGLKNTILVNENETHSILERDRKQ